MYPGLLALGLAVLLISARAADLIPVEDFARPPAFSNVGLAPDGQTCAFLREIDGRDQLFFANVTSVKVQGFDMGWAEAVHGAREVMWYRWLGPNRVLVGIGLSGNRIEGTAAFDRNGQNWQAVSGLVGYGRGIRLNYHPLLAFHVLHTFNDDTRVLMLDERETNGNKERLFPHVVEINTRTGSAERVVKNPGQVISWLPDRQGVVRIGLERMNGRVSFIQREGAKGAWKPMPELNRDVDDLPMPMGFSSDGKGIYMAALNEKRFRALYLCDLTSGKTGEPLLELSDNDVEFAHSGFLAGPIWSDKKQAIVGFRYITDGPQVKWFDPEYAQNMAAVDAALPGKVNLPMNISNNDQTMLILSFSDRTPGQYYIYSPEKSTLTAFVSTCPWIKAEQMAPMYPVAYKARDGLEVHGYLTVPLGQKPLNLPLVVMPHGGPWVRDTWGYNPLVQMLANRGYAVLQMNYRGSVGYGQEFSRKGRNQVGGAIQLDIEDATRWAIGKKIADSKRIAIVGGSYGGYSALYALGRSPGMYCCGISIAGVSDWLSIYKNMSDPEYLFAREHWLKEIGDPEKDEEKLKAISPVNFAKDITAPVLIIHGKDDKIVPPKQAKKMVSALEKAGHKPESLFISGEGHGFRSEKARVAEYKAIEAFLAKHLGATK